MIGGNKNVPGDGASMGAAANPQRARAATGEDVPMEVLADIGPPPKPVPEPDTVRVSSVSTLRC